MTREKDLVLINVDGAPGTYARIESIEPDPKPGWHRVRLLVLSVPPQVVTWILRAEYIDGGEFTMGGIPIRLEKVVPPAEEPPSQEKTEETEEEGGKVVSLFSRKKDNT